MKKRLDVLLFEKGYFESREKARIAIMEGLVFVNKAISDKPGTQVNEDALIEVKGDTCPYVGRGGYKIAKALDVFGIDPAGFVCADIGASTGGFTDCLLQNGAKKVFSVDLNDNLLHKSLKNDFRVIPVIKNAKLLTKTDFDSLDFLTADLSFISAKQVLKVFYDLLPNGGKMVLLIKPQFEVGEKRKFKNGIIKDDKLRKEVCGSVVDYAKNVGFSTLKMTTAPQFKDKNIEFLILLQKGTEGGIPFDEMYKI